jgi:mono/diheme cytochrome c family protein
MTAFALVTSAQGAGEQRPTTGKELYEAACVSCHGAGGKGADRAKVGFDTPLPDFTDCSFATREPDADWRAVTHEGGPARGFSETMPSSGDALSGEEIQKVLDYIRGFCTNPAWPRGELNLPRPLVTEKAFPEDEAVWTTTVAAEGPGAVTNKLVYERRFGARNQIEFMVPFDFKHTASSSWSGGIGDIALGLKRVLFHSLGAGSILSVSAETILPTGKKSGSGIGKGYTVFESFLTFGQLLPSESFLHFQGGVEVPAGGHGAAKEAFWRTTVGRSLTQGSFGRTWSPMVELLAARELQSGAKADWDLLPQFQVTLSRRQHIMLNFGVRVPLNNAGPRPAQIMMYLLWDWFDGGFREGW